MPTAPPTGPPRSRPTTPVIVAARRTPIGTAGGALADQHVVDLAAAVLDALHQDVRRLGFDDPVEEIVLGNTRGPGGNIARVAALQAGLRVPGLTIDRQCGSGQAAVHLAADQIRAGSAGLVFAGGAESASTQPITAHPGDPAATYLRARFAPAPDDDPEMGPAAQLVADEAEISRAAQDAYALASHRLTLASQAGDGERAELVPLAGLTRDERPRVLKQSVLERFPGVFGGSGSVTTGNSCGVSDGAAAVAVVPESRRAEVGVPGLALLGWVTVAGDPRRPGLMIVPAVSELLASLQLCLAQVDVLEVTEAFAGQVLACAHGLGLDPLNAPAGPPLLCPDGGAIARGHPWGASGALLLVRLFDQLLRRPQRHGNPTRGIAACAIGGGQGVALLVERVG